MTTSSSAKLKMHSIHFAHPGNEAAVFLRNERTNRLLGAEPEWVASGRAEPGAFVGGTRPTLEVVLAASGAEHPPNGEHRIVARDADGRVAVGPHRVRLHFGSDRRAAPVRLPLAEPLPGGPSVHAVRWHWSLESAGASTPIGTSAHEIFLTRAQVGPAATWLAGEALTPSPPSDAPHVDRWAYRRVVEWTCAWATGATTERDVCDAILANVARSGLRYYLPAWDVQTMLLKGGGMCGGWYLMFQAMAAAQGVSVERRSYSVDWRQEPRDEARWCAIVVRHPGVNRTEPGESASTFHDTDVAGPHAPVVDVTERRYRFWGVPGGVRDGHCVNFLRSAGRYYLYDASFMTTAVPLEGFALPDPDRSTRVRVDTQGSFKSAYLDGAVAYMLGCLHHNGRFYETAHNPTGETVNGLSVLTSTIGADGPGIDFYWGP